MVNLFSSDQTQSTSTKQIDSYQQPQTTKVLDQSLLEHTSLTSESPKAAASKQHNTWYKSPSTEFMPHPLPPADTIDSDRTKARCAAKCASQKHCFQSNDMTATNPDKQHEFAEPKSCDRKRDKAKKIMASKGPRIAGAAAAIGMFIFNVLSSCG